MKTLGAVAVAAALAATSAHAQTTILNPFANPPLTNPPPINWADPIIRVTTTFRIAVATKDTESQNDAKAQETGRRSLYGMAQGECAILSEIFKAECRLNSFTIWSLALPPNIPPTSMMAASAVYELKPAGQASGR